MTTRLALGSVSTLAAAALVLGAAPYLFNRVMGEAHVAPWGAISPLAIGPSEAAAADRAKLLKLAALKTDSDAETRAVTQPSVITQAGDPPVASPAIAADVPSPTASTPETPAPVAVPDQTSQPIQLASAEALPDEADARTTTGAVGLININTASTDALDHLPGAGRIGHAIVSHRPYRAINDLVRKRVLRMSDYQKIQSRIRAD